MPRVRAALAICGALAALAAFAAPRTARAQTGLSEGLRVQGGYARVTPQEPNDDVFLSATPSISFLLDRPRSLLRVTYALSVTGHTAFAAEIANHLGLASSFELSKTAGLILTADATQTSIAQELIARPASQATLSPLPASNTRILTTSVGEATSFDTSPVVRLGQSLDGGWVTSLPRDQDTLFENYLANAGFTADRTFKKDSLGVVARGGWAYYKLPNVPDQQVLTAALAPNWRHDISRSLTASLSAGAALAAGVGSGDTKPLVTPFVQAALHYLWQDATVDLGGSGGPQANFLTGQMIDAQTVTLHGSIPVSVRHHLVAGASSGYSHGRVISLTKDVPKLPDFDAVTADAELAWSPSEWVQLFVRYQFNDQISDDANVPAFVRHAGIVGVALTSRPDTVRVPTHFPRRVDRADAPAPSSPEPTSSEPTSSEPSSSPAPAPAPPPP
jgi:hypothetical protein